MPPRKSPHRSVLATRVASTVSMLAGGTSAPTLALVDEVLGLDSTAVTWGPAPLTLAASTDLPGGDAAAEPPPLQLLPSLDGR